MIWGAGKSGNPWARFTALWRKARRVISRMTLSVMPRVRSARKRWRFRRAGMSLAWQAEAIVTVHARIMTGVAHFSMVTNQQLYLAIGIPMLFNAALIGLLVGLMNAKFGAIDKRFDDMRDLWRAELRRVEEVLDARLKHLE